MHLDGAAVRSCQLPCARRGGKPITTIEGLSADGSHPVQRAWVETTCRSAATARPGRSWPPPRCSQDTPNPTDAEIDAAMSGNICRCGTYQRIRAAIHRAAGGAA